MSIAISIFISIQNKTKEKAINKIVIHYIKTNYKTK